MKRLLLVLSVLLILSSNSYAWVVGSPAEAGGSVAVTETTANSTDNHLICTDGATGRVIQQCNATSSISQALSIASDLTIKNGNGDAVVIEPDGGSNVAYITITKPQSDDTVFAIEMSYEKTGKTPKLLFKTARGAPGTPTVVVAHDEVGGTRRDAYNGSDYVTIAQDIAYVDKVNGAILSGGFILYSIDESGVTHPAIITDDNSNIHIGNNATPLASKSEVGSEGALIVKDSTCPTSNITNGFSLCANDDGAGDGAPQFRSENGSIYRFGEVEQTLMYDNNPTAPVVGDSNVKIFKQTRSLADDADGACETDGSDCIFFYIPTTSATIHIQTNNMHTAVYSINNTGTSINELEDYQDKFSNASCTGGHNDRFCIFDVANPANGVALINDTGGVQTVTVYTVFD